MKRIIKFQKVILVAGAFAFLFAGCDNKGIYEDEHYKTLVYLLSGTDNIYGAS
jgi:hypothetical protein